MTRALIVEDDPKIRANLEYQLRGDGFETVAVGDAEGALALIEREGEPAPGLLLLDVRLPGISGVELVRRLVEADRLPPTVVLSGEATPGEAVEALRLGVQDFVEKPFSAERLRRSVTNALEATSLRREVARLRAELEGEPEMIGDSPPMLELKRAIERVAATDARVLIRGESGTGKELVADAIHRASARRDGPFVKLNCAAIPTHLIEDELFGHARGAFTDARADKPGLFEAADGGILLLDEIGDMEVTLQSRLLRVLEDGRVRRIGETRERAVDVRVIAATHADLEAAVADGRFREDLYYRLARLPLDLPPLRERGDDLGRLAEQFLARFARRHHVPPRTLDAGARRCLEAYPWPGNVRELEALCERLVIFATDPVTADQLPERYRDRAAAAPAAGEHPPLLADRPPRLTLGDFRRRAERDYLRLTLTATGWNVAAAARRLGVDRTHLHHRLRALGLRRPG